MTMAETLPAMKTNPKMIVFTDWDGTVTIQDSNDYLTDNLGFGVEKRREVNKRILDGQVSFRDGFTEMIDSVPLPFPECIEYLKEHVQLDPGFVDFYQWASENNVPVVVVSSGMEPIIRALLTKLVGEKAAQNIQIVANDVDLREDGTWNVKFRDETPHGHDKSRAIRPYAQLDKSVRPTIFYCGDGVSDLSAAREADLLFAKEGRDLITFCEREKIPFTVFSSFKQIHDTVKAVFEGKQTVASVQA
uniref:ARAD1D39468p n=1 Tax=Blastobotrys adeninivorans TaxID=409370 RepID=A0A060TCI5_BLAAD